MNSTENTSTKETVYSKHKHSHLLC